MKIFVLWLRIVSVVCFILFFCIEIKLMANSSEYKIVEVKFLGSKAIGQRRLSEVNSAELEVLPVNKRMTYKAVVSPHIKYEEIRPTIEKIIDDITSKDPDIDMITLWLYSNEKVNRPWDIAMATWGPNGEWGGIDPQIAATNDRSNYKTLIEATVGEDEDTALKSRLNEIESLDELTIQESKKLRKAPEKFVVRRFSEEKRKEIHTVFVKSQDRADLEAEQKYDMFKQGDKFRKYYHKLLAKYENAVLKKYGITRKEMDQISSEADIEDWPLPDV